MDLNKIAAAERIAGEIAERLWVEEYIRLTTSEPDLTKQQLTTLLAALIYPHIVAREEIERLAREAAEQLDDAGLLSIHNDQVAEIIAGVFKGKGN